MRFPLLTLVLFLFQSNLIFGQLKFEREYRLKAEEVPKSALEFIDRFPFENKIRWYKEEGFNNQVSLEAKTKHESKRYSIEFDSVGRFEDVEVEWEWKELPNVVQQNLCSYLDSAHKKFKISKVQVQYTGNSEKIVAYFSNSEASPTAKDLVICYELVVETNDGKGQRDIEYLFSQNAKFLGRTFFLSKNTDILEY